MEILDLLTLCFCVLAVVLNAAACFVLLKRKTGKGARAYPFVFAAFSFIFIIMGCIGYLFSAYAIAMPATLVMSGLCMLIYCATEKPPARSFEGAPQNWSSPNLSFLMKKSAEPAVQAPEADPDFGIDIDSLIADSSFLNADSDSGYSSADFDSLLDEPSSSDDDISYDDLGIDFDSLLDEASPLDDDVSDDDVSYEDLGVHFDTLIAQSSSLNDDSASDGLGFSADDLDDFDLDVGSDGEFDVVFPPDEEFDAEFPQDAEEDKPISEPLLDEPLEEDSSLADFSQDGSGDFTADVAEGILKAGQAIVARVAQSMREEACLESLLDFANSLLMEHTGADGGIIFLAGEDVLTAKAFGGQFAPPCKLADDVLGDEDAVKDALRRASIPLEGNIFGDAALSGEALCIEDGKSDGRVYQNGSNDFLEVGSYIIAPLAANDSVVGVAGLARPPQKEPFSQKDFKAAKALAGYAGAAVGNVNSFKEIMASADLESDAASKIQRALLPKELPDLPSAGFGFFFEGARGVCTDFCDVIFSRRDRIALVMADVAGEGIASCMAMTGLRALFRLVTNTTQDAATILDWVNKSITEKNASTESRAAVAYVLYSPETNEISFASAGNQPVLLWRAAEKTIESVSAVSEPLGTDRNAEYKEKKLTVAAGDAIVLCTDGLVDALNEQGEQYGFNGLSRVLAANEGAAAKDIAAAVRQDLAGAAPLRDDQTLLILKIENP